jgi:zinc transporter, ZIP family
MTAHGRAPRAVIGLWVAVAAVCTLATIAGYALADAVSDEFKAGVDGFAAGALLVMLVDSMIPEAARKAGRPAGLVTVLGFAVAAGLSTMS